MDESETPQSAHDVFYIARAEALNAYALMERSMSILFADTLGTNPRYATLIISKMNSARARNEVVQRIVDFHTVKTFRLFTNSLFVEIGKVDGLRNQLVHWHVKQRADESLALVPSDILATSDAKMDEGEIDALGHKCLFLAAVTREFGKHLEDWSNSPALHERFLQPLSYPPARDDLLFRHHIDSIIPPEPLAQ